MDIESEIERLKLISSSCFTLYWIYKDDEFLATAHSLEETKKIINEKRQLGMKFRVDKFIKNFYVA